MVSGRRTNSSGAGGPLGPLPPVSSKAKDYTERPEEVVDELDDLRTRGIAKVLNKHFTTTTKQLAKEKAQADSALADLERRRAQTKAFVPSKGGDLNPYDQMYVQLQQKRTECRRKEKETMMLYQRYVMKYGKSAKAKPLVESSSSNDLQDGGKDDSASAALKSSNSGDLKGDPPGKSVLGTLDENSEITFSKFYEKQQEEQEQIKPEDNEKNTQHFMSALNKFMTVSEDEEDQQQEEQQQDKNGEQTSVPELVPSKDSQPSPVSPKVDPFASAISKFTTTEPVLVDLDDDIQSETADAAANIAESEKQTTDEGNDQVADADADAASIEEQPEITRISSNDPPGRNLLLSGEDESMVSQDNKGPSPPPRKSQTAKAVHVESKQSLTTQETTDETAHLTPDVVPAAAAITLSPSSHNSTPKSNKVVRIEVNEASCFHTTTVEGCEYDDRSIISELTSANSAVTRQLIDDVETEMEDFIKFEMEAIRQMLDSEAEDGSALDHSITGGDNQSEASSLMAGDQSVHVALKAEAMALEMQKILDDFANEDASVTGSKSILNESAESSEHKNNETPATKNVYPYKFEPAISGEEWYVHYDETYQKEFYVEKKSTRTQWDYPTKKMPASPVNQQPISSEEFLSDMHSVASSRRSLSRKNSRRSLYRKQRKKRRARRLMVSFLALLCVLVTVFYWRIHHPEESVTGALAAFVVSLKSMDIKNQVVDQYEYSFTDRKAREEETEIHLQQANAKAEKEKKARELAAQKEKEKEEAKRLTKEAKEKTAREQEAVRKLTREQEAASEAAKEAARKLTRKQEAARQQQLAREEAERLTKIEAAEQKKREETTEIELISSKNNDDQKAGHRNLGCNIPFAYIVPHCFRLAKTNPIFGLKNENDLSFLQ